MRYLLLILLLLIGCSENSSNGLAGNGSEVGNPKVIGTITDQKGTPLTNSSIVVCSKTYSPYSNETVLTTKTDSHGKFEIEFTELGNYTLLIHSSDSLQGKLFTQTISESTTIDLDMLTLEKTEKLTIVRTSSEKSIDFYAEGTTIKKSFSIGKDSLEIAHLPIGEYTFLIKEDNNTLFETTIQSDTSNTVVIEDKEKGTAQKDRLLFITPQNWDSTTSLWQSYRNKIDTALYLSIARPITALSESDITQSNGLVILPYTEIDTIITSILDTLQKPIIIAEPSFYHLLNMTDSNTENYGREVASSFLMYNNEHPLTKSLNLGPTVAVELTFSGNGNLGWGEPSNYAERIGVSLLNQKHSILFVYETGKEMVGKKAPHRRIGLPFDNSTLSSEGEEILLNALNWLTTK